MAITRAQQVRQMLEKGGRLGLFRGALADTKGGKAMSPGTSADYSPGQGNRQDREKRGGPPGGGDPKMKYTAPPKDYDRSKDTGPDRFKLAEQNRIKAEEEARRKAKEEAERIKLRQFAVEKPTYLDRVNQLKNLSPFSIVTDKFFKPLLEKGQKINDAFYEENRDIIEKKSGIGNQKDYFTARLEGKIDAYGNPIGDSYRDSQGNIVTRGGGQDQPIVPIVPTTTGIASTAAGTTAASDTSDLDDYIAQMREGAAYRFFADGGRADDEEDYVGGIMDLESARQMYGLGKLVKKVTKGVKKIVKSPIGKAALLGAGLGFAGYGPMKGLFSGVKGAGFLKNMAINKKLLGTADYMGGPTGIFDLIKSNPFKSIFAASTLAGLMTPKEQDGDEEVYLGPTIDIPGIRKNPYAAMGETYRFYADGGKAEPVAKKTMPLLDMDGMEKDYRADGGFVPIGRMERADDVPARLSKNEFVFTADAVRNAGDGDVDKGAEVMYNMMKNLEAGGNVSEESQGLDGARKMFQTSQRLEEVL